MRVIARKALREYAAKEPGAAAELEAWFAEARHAEWKTPVDVKVKYGNASILKNGRVVFNICGNNYRSGPSELRGWTYLHPVHRHA